MIEFDLPAPLPEPPAAPPPPDADIPPEAFGARQAVALTPEAIDDPLYRREAATANATRVEELNNDFIGRQREILHTGPDAFYRRQGRDAILAASDVIGRLNAAQDEVLGQAAMPSQKAMLSKILDNHMLVTHYGIGSHVGRQSLEWQKGVAQARLDQLHEQARLDYGDQASIANYADAGEAAAQDHARLSGLASDSDEAQARASAARSAIHRTAIESALEANDNEAASTLHDQAKDNLIPADAAVIEPQLKAAAEIATAHDYIGKILDQQDRERENADDAGDAPAEPEQANSEVHNISEDAIDSEGPPGFFNAYQKRRDAEADHADATIQNETDWPDNRSQRATNQHLIDVHFGTKKRQIEQTSDRLNNEIARWIVTPTPDGQPQVERPPPALWSQLSYDQQRSVDAFLARNATGTHAVTNGDAERDLPDKAPEFKSTVLHSLNGASNDDLFIPAQGGDVQKSRQQSLAEEDKYVDSLGRKVRLERQVRIYVEGSPGYMVADVLNAPNGVDYINIVEIKSGAARLSPNQLRVLAEAVKSGRIYIVNAVKAATLEIKPHVTFAAQGLVAQVAIVGGNEEAVRRQFMGVGIPEVPGGKLRIGPGLPGVGSGRAF